MKTSKKALKNSLIARVKDYIIDTEAEEYWGSFAKHHLKGVSLKDARSISFSHIYIVALRISMPSKQVNDIIKECWEAVNEI